MDIEIARRLTSSEDPDVRALAEGAVTKLQPNGEPVVAIVDDDVLRCPLCGNSDFGYIEGCQDYRTPGGQDDEKRLVTVHWHADGTGETGDSNPGLFCDNYREGGCGRAITLPDEWDIDFD